MRRQLARLLRRTAAHLDRGAPVTNIYVQPPTDPIVVARQVDRALRRYTRPSAIN